MKQLPDISAYYTAERALAEDVQWLLSGVHNGYAAWLLPLLDEHKVKSIVELGCGSGILASKIPPEVVYLGVDRNTHFLERARQRAGGLGPMFRRFLCWDARNHSDEPKDLAMAWDFLKHFSLGEFERMVKKVCSLGRLAVFNVQLAEEDDDDGTEFHHTYVTRERLNRAVEAAGHRVLAEHLFKEWARPDGRAASCWGFLTELVVPQGKPLIDVPCEEHPPEIRGHEPPPVLTVGGNAMKDLNNYTIRWVLLPGEGARYEPVLYRGGKRVTAPWTVAIKHSSPQAGEEGSANTA